MNDFILSTSYSPVMGFPGGSVVKNPPANAGDTRDVGSSILDWKIPWTDKPSGLQSMGV